jgi:NADH-quinone oxidoreductase subunit D
MSSTDATSRAPGHAQRSRAHSRLASLERDPLLDDRTVINFGPQHPATHGTLRMILELEGERVVKCTPEIGYLHTGMEKLGEHLNWNQWVAVSDRMNYLSCLNNNVGFHVACEELFEIEVPERARVARVLLAELSRLADHVICLGLMAMDIGAFTVMLWTFAERERLYDIFEAVTGARMTTSFTRVGGIFRDVPQDFETMCRNTVERFHKVLDEMDFMLARNRIFRDRLEGVGVISKEFAMSYGLTGPIARASGIDRDVRRDRPYLGYDRYDWEVPVVPEGDCFARYRQRVLECRQSLRIIEQALPELQPGPYRSDDPRVALPTKQDVWTDMESLIHHFMDIMPNRGLRAERGEVYSATEVPNGELGFYLVSDGEGPVAYRLRVRPPSFINFAIMEELGPGHMVSDIVAILCTLNIIAGELDR